jgi:hypothetical protein
MTESNIDIQKTNNIKRISWASAVSAFFLMEMYMIIEIADRHKIDESDPN